MFQEAGPKEQKAREPNLTVFERAVSRAKNCQQNDSWEYKYKGVHKQPMVCDAQLAAQLYKQDDLYTQ